LFKIAIAALLLSTTICYADATIVVSIKKQTLSMTNDGVVTTYPVSTAGNGMITPVGKYQPESYQVMHYSKKYHMSPMPYSIFFKGGYAIHGVYGGDNKRIGHPASHGCVRMHPENAKFVFEQTKGKPLTIIVQ
jgi:lipoprotein-anchoring transpeptidase ErfK/SrfK